MVRLAAADETLDGKEALADASADAFMRQAVYLLIAAERGGEFGERYVAALRRDPRVVLAHAQVVKRFGSGNDVNLNCANSGLAYLSDSFTTETHRRAAENPE